MNVLPEKPSALIRLALADLRKVEQDPQYEVDMEKWHHPGAQTCMVCLAGAVIAKSLAADPNTGSSPGTLHEQGKISGPDLEKLLALNNFRENYTRAGFMRVTGRDVPHVTEFPWVPHYDVDPERFHLALNRTADIFEKEGY
jgi:hypothetical protein